MAVLTAQEFMEKSVITLSPGEDIHDAMHTLLKKKLSGAPVVDADNRVVGILSEKDCLRIVLASAFERLPEGVVRDYMTTEVQTLHPSSTIYDIANRFLSTPFRRVPVVSEHGHLLGVVSRTGVVRVIASMRDDPELYGTSGSEPEKESAGVDSAMRRARRR